MAIDFTMSIPETDMIPQDRNTIPNKATIRIGEKGEFACRVG